MAAASKPTIVSYNSKSETFRECLLHIIKWYSPEGAELRVKSKRKGKIYTKDDLKLISSISIGIAPRYCRDGKSITYVNTKGQINHRNLEKILRGQELLKEAEIIEVVKKEFKHYQKSISPESGTLYCALFVNIYRLTPQPKSEDLKL
ncbi:MAG: hypothetical protein ACPLXC_01530 [Candidatus Pacearchaeota archaeon]